MDLSTYLAATEDFFFLIAATEFLFPLRGLSQFYGGKSKKKSKLRIIDLLMNGEEFKEEDVDAKDFEKKRKNFLRRIFSLNDINRKVALEISLKSMQKKKSKLTIIDLLMNGEEFKEEDEDAKDFKKKRKNSLRRSFSLNDIRA